MSLATPMSLEHLNELGLEPYGDTLEDELVNEELQMQGEAMHRTHNWFNTQLTKSDEQLLRKVRYACDEYEFGVIYTAMRNRAV